MIIGLLLYFGSLLTMVSEQNMPTFSNKSTQLTTIKASNLKNLKFRNYSIQDGLSQATVLSIFQDRQGFIWLGTLEGLNRFDGYQFKTWRFETQNEYSISHNVIYQISEEDANHLWIGTHNGLCRFDKTTERFERFFNEKISGGQNSIIALHNGGEKQLWVGTERGLFRFDKKTKAFTSINEVTTQGIGLNEKFIESLAMDSQKQLWIATNANGLFMLNTSSGKLKQYVNEKGSQNSLASNRLQRLLVNKEDKVWIGTKDAGINCLDPAAHSFLNYRHDPENSNSLSSDQIMSLYMDSEESIWVGTADAGLNVLDQSNGKFVTFENDPLSRSSLPDNVVRAMASDQNGNLILGHSSKGFCIADQSTNIFKHIKHAPFDENSLSHDNIWSILEDAEHNLWIGTSDGLNKYNPVSNSFQIYRLDKSNDNSISQNYVRHVLEDSKGRIWIGTYGGVNLLNPTTSKIRRFNVDPNTPKGLNDRKVRRIFQDRNEVIWIATAEGGLNRYDDHKDEFIAYTNDPKDPTSISGNSLRSIIEDEEGFLWLGTDQGLNRFDKASQKFENYENIPGDPSSLSNNSIQHLYISKNNQFWVCTNGGLNLFDTKTKKFKSWGLKQGLSNEIVYGVLEDKNGFLWMSTNKGINKFDPETETFIWYDELDGLQSNEFNAGAFTTNSKGLMYFGGVNGLNVFDPLQIGTNAYVPPVVLTDFLLFNKSVDIQEDGVLPSAVTTVPKIDLDYKDFFFAIEFSALNFRQPEKNKYAYRLKPFNTDWIYTTYQDRKAVYTNVPPGNYVFTVKASNDDGLWNEEGISMDIRINPPWWMLWWMKLLYAIVSIFLIVLFYKIRTRRLKIQKQVLKRMVKERTLEIEHKKEELKKKNVELGNKNDALSNALNDLASTQRQLIQSEKMASLGVLSSGVSHEINNPLNFIHGGVSGLAKEIENVKSTDKKQFKVYIEAIQEGVNRASKIIKGLNQFSQQSGSDNEEININEVIDNCLEILRSSIGQDVIIKKLYDQDTPTVFGSRSKYHQTIVNILTNANQAIDKGGEIEISTVKQDQVAKLIITDNGSGIPEEDLKKVTDPFFTTRAQGQGTGLGLYTSYNLIKEMDGSMEITSEIGKGTTVTINLPCTSP